MTTLTLKKMGAANNEFFTGNHRVQSSFNDNQGNDWFIQVTAHIKDDTTPHAKGVEIGQPVYFMTLVKNDLGRKVTRGLKSLPELLGVILDYTGVNFHCIEV